MHYYVLLFEDRDGMDEWIMDAVDYLINEGYNPSVKRPGVILKVANIEIKPVHIQNAEKRLRGVPRKTFVINLTDREPEVTKSNRFEIVMDTHPEIAVEMAEISES